MQSRSETQSLLPARPPLLKLCSFKVVQTEFVTRTETEFALSDTLFIHSCWVRFGDFAVCAGDYPGTIMQREIKNCVLISV